MNNFALFILLGISTLTSCLCWLQRPLTLQARHAVHDRDHSSSNCPAIRPRSPLMMTIWSPDRVSESPRWTSAGLLSNFFDEIESAFGSSDANIKKLAVDVTETPNSYSIVADVPGVKKEDVEVTVDERLEHVTITCERRSLEKIESDKVRREERYNGLCQRFLVLPKDADPHNISAKYEDGVMHVHIAKKPTDPKKLLRTVPVQ